MINKIHVGCGDVYLEGYDNVDVDGVFVDDIEENTNVTTLDNYFKFPMGSPRRNIIVDGFLNVLQPWDAYEDGSIEEIVMISCIEHFTKKEAEFIISEIKRVLKPGGKLIIDFPDLKKDFEDYYVSDPEWFMELVYCNHKNEYSCHKWGYTMETFRNLLGDGWQSVKWNTVVKHDYPMTGCVAIKGEKNDN